MAAAAAIALRPALGTMERSTSRLKTRFDKSNNRATASIGVRKWRVGWSSEINNWLRRRRLFAVPPNS